MFNGYFIGYNTKPVDDEPNAVPNNTFYIKGKCHWRYDPY
jgi:hypothetical protein